MSETQTEKSARYLASHSSVLLKQAMKILEARLAKEPDNGKLWFQLGNIHRGLGGLEAAGYAFTRSAEASYESEFCSYLINLCNLRPNKLTYFEWDFTPTPFLLCRDLLTDEELCMAWQVLGKHADKFKYSRVGNSQVRKNTRDSITLSSNRFKPLCDIFQDRITSSIKQAFEVFDIKPPKRQLHDVQMTSHTDGEFYRTHADTSSRQARLLSYVYYFHKQPKAFTGGQLQLFDTNTKLNTASTTMTTIEPAHNSLIIFPSNYYHQVCTVNMPNHDRIWGRHAINGWLVDAEKQAEIDAQNKK